LFGRVDRHSASPTTYLRHFVLAGGNGLRGVAFGPAATAHFFNRRAEAEEIVRKLRRRVSHAEYEYTAEEAASEPSPRLAAFHWQ
jgi:hypothetical protein